MMKYRTIKFLRAASTILVAGTLLQANGCLLQETTNGLILAILGTYIQDLVAGGFNLV